MRTISFSLVSMAALGALSVLACGESGSKPIPIPASGGSDAAGGTVGAGGATLPTGGTGTESGGTGNETSTGGTGTEAGGSDPGTGGGGSIEGTPLIFDNGWLAADANTLGIQGALFSYADSHTETGDGVGPAMVTNIEENGPLACITGEAFKVDTKCEDIPDFMFTPPAVDCFGEYWGAAIGFNLNQPSVVDEETGEEVGGDPVAYDASGKISAFSFDLTGATIPTSMRFAIDVGPNADSTTQYCTTKETKVFEGTNTIKIDDLREKCWETAAFDSNAHPDPSQIVKIAWAVVTNSSSATPFDFCVGNIIAVQ